MKRICVVEDESVVRDIFTRLFRKKEVDLTFFERGDDAVHALEEGQVFDVVITDMMLPGKSGLQVLETSRAANEGMPVIVMTAYASIDSAVDAMKGGAFDYITKPFNNEEVLLVVEKALKQQSLLHENKQLKMALEEKYCFSNIVGRSQPMLDVFEMIKMAAPSNATILIRGESGTGKELIARAIHFNSMRKHKPFMAVNAGAIPGDLLESQLFGHTKGAFTGAVAEKAGLFEAADQGSFFMDEIGNLSLELQSKLLRVLQEREIMPVGSNQVKKVDVRMICATNLDLEAAINDGEFREDLYYRLNVIEIVLPPLREKREDIPLLVSFFVQKYGNHNGKTVTGISSEFMESLESYDFPGNVRELENIIERAVVLTRDNILKKEDLPGKVLLKRKVRTFKLKTGKSFSEQTLEFEKELLLYGLEQSGGVQKKAAELLGMKPTTLHEKLKRHNLR